MATRKKASVVEPDERYEDRNYWILPSGVVIRWTDVVAVVNVEQKPEDGGREGVLLTFVDGDRTLSLFDPADVRALRQGFLAVAVEVP